MAHSNRLRVHWTFFALEVVLFVGAIVSVYLSEVHNWRWFTAVSVLAVFLFVVVKVVDALPIAKDLLALEDVASKLANAAMPYGVVDYFNMQSARDQARRNEATQEELKNARTLWLCANSGVSYLEPSVYRHWPAVEKRLKDGVEFRVVLLDPLSAEKGFRNQLNVDGEQFDSKMNLASLIKLYNDYPTLEIRFVRYGMHATVFATENCLFFDPYHVGLVGNRIENRSFCLHIVPTTPAEGVGLFRLFKSHFDTLWRSGTSFEQWFPEAKERLPSNLPHLKERQYAA